MIILNFLPSSGICSSATLKYQPDCFYPSTFARSLAALTNFTIIERSRYGYRSKGCDVDYV